MRDTRSELLFEAEVLVRRRGYSGFSYGDLAQAVGIRKASIHHHFPTKEILARALVAAYDQRYDAELAGIRGSKSDAIARIDGYARLYLTGVEKGLGCLCAALAVELDTLPAALRGDVARFFEKHVGWIEAVLAEGIADGSARRTLDPHASARMVIATLEGALLLERLLDGPVGFETALSAMKDAIAPASSP